MSDNELIIKLQNDVLNALNSSQMPLMVKALVLENVLLKVNTSVKDEFYRKQAQAAEQSNEANKEVNLHVDTLEMNTGTKDKQEEA